MPNSSAQASLKVPDDHEESSWTVTCASSRPSLIHTDASRMSGCIRRNVSVALGSHPLSTRQAAMSQLSAAFGEDLSLAKEYVSWSFLNGDVEALASREGGYDPGVAFEVFQKSLTSHFGQWFRFKAAEYSGA